MNDAGLFERDLFRRAAIVMLSSTGGTAATRPALSPRAAWYALVVMTACYSLAFVDRQILNLLVEPIRKQFGVTDAQAGYLLGPAFTLSYVLLGLPAGWCADRFNRRTLVLVAGLLWSFATVSAAFVQSYEGLFVTRVLVGGSEAFLFPAGMSLIAELFDRRRLPLATAVFLLSPYIGGGLALIFGGIVLGYTLNLPPVAVPLFGLMHGWQATFLAVGLLGLVPVLLLLPVREPPRDDMGGGGDRPLGLVEGSGYMLSRWRFFLMFFLGASCSSLVLATVPAWAPTFLIRRFGMTQASVGVEYGMLVLLFGLAGGILSPLANAWLSRRYSDTPMRTVLIGPVLLFASACLLGLSGTRGTALASLSLMTFAYSFPLSVAGTSLQVATPPRLRGLAAAYYFIIVSLVSWGVGPTLVPLMTGRVFHDDKAIGPALAIIAAVFAGGALTLLSVALRGFRRERRIVDPRLGAVQPK